MCLLEFLDRARSEQTMVPQFTAVLAVWFQRFKMPQSLIRLGAIFDRNRWARTLWGLVALLILVVGDAATIVSTDPSLFAPVSPLSSLVLCCLVFVLSCPVVLSCLVLCCVALSCPVLSCPVLSCLFLSCSVLSCPVLSCLVLSCLVLSCPVRSCVVLC